MIIVMTVSSFIALSTFILSRGVYFDENYGLGFGMKNIFEGRHRCELSKGTIFGFSNLRFEHYRDSSIQTYRIAPNLIFQ